jgi:hypothetical protein
MAALDRRRLLQGGSVAALLAGWTGGQAAEEPSPGRARRRIKVGQIGVGHAHAEKLSVFRASPD